jgi:hypothetical protein
MLHGDMMASMRLEPFCRLAMRYTEGAFLQPYGSRGGGEEWVGFGTGNGEVTGHLQGAMAWSNAPRRRQDGVWTPNLRGLLTTNDGLEIIVSIHGQSVEERSPGHRRAILARVELTTDAEPLRWLNTSFLVGEGEIDEEREHWWMDVFVCVNEVAQGPPALGAEPPERFRQRAAGGSAP